MRQVPGVHGGRVVWVARPEEVRIMAEAEGYAMVRRKGCVPFVVQLKELEFAGSAMKEGKE